MPERNHGPISKREEALLSWIEQFAPYGVITLDEVLQVKGWNHWMELHSAKKVEDVDGKNLFELFPNLKERRLASYFERALQGESSVLSTSLHHYLVPLPSPFREPGIDYMLQTARIAPLFCDGKVCGVVIVIEDVTQRESQASTLNRQHRRDELLSWTLAQLLKTEQPSREVRQLFFKIAEQLDFDTFLIYFYNIETGALELDTIGGIPPESENDFAHCPFLTMLPEGSNEIAILNSMAKQPGPESAIFRKAGISAAIVMPLAANERSLGVLCFATGSRESILPEEADLVKTIGRYLATAVDKENANRLLHHAKEELSQHSKLLEIKVEERTARLREIISELETFSYTVAHDLRAPVRGTTAYCEVLIEDFADQLPAEAKRIVEQIAKISSRMEMLTRDLLEFSKVSRQEIVMSRVELQPVIEELAMLQIPSVRNAVTISSPLHSVRAHKALLQQVFTNLIDNAVKFVPPQTHPRITISTELVFRGAPNTRMRTLEFSSTESWSVTGATSASIPSFNQVRIWVRDEGIGISPGAHQKIFGIFERGQTSERYPGTGIGLAIVARAVQRMGGTCGVESEVGKGSGFWIDLPVAE
jgi:signal transduction histidine kinase